MILDRASSQVQPGASLAACAGAVYGRCGKASGRFASPRKWCIIS